MKKAFIFSWISLVFSFSYAAEQFSPAKYFDTGTTYSYVAGTRGFSGGKVHLIQKDGILHIQAKIRFLGAGTFSRTNLKEVQQISHPAIPPTDKFFQGNIDSFGENPELAKRIQDLVQAIEKQFKTPYSQLEISVEFGKDSDYLKPKQRIEKDYGTYLTNLRSRVEEVHSKMKTDAIPISIVARPEASRASPSEWDLYSDPRLFAHEFFHVIGSGFEGYECAGYPPNGLMQDESMMKAVDQIAKGRKAATLLLSDFLELLSNFGSLKQIEPEPHNEAELDSWIENSSSSSVCMKLNDNSRQDYVSWSLEKRDQAAQKDVKAWLSQKPGQSLFLQ